MKESYSMSVEKKGYYRRDDVARSYDLIRFKSAAGQLTHETELAAIKGSFAPNERLIELGCGTARLLKALNGQGWDVLALDQSPAMLRAGGLEPGPRVLVADVSRIPLPDAALDGAYTFRMTNHLPDLRPLLSECRRILRPGGHFVFDTMRWSALRLDWLHKGGKNFPVADRQTAAWLEETGWRVASVSALFPVGPYLLSGMPLPLAKWLMTTSAWPASLYAVAVWHARKP
jgi:SAM-dependent methyltransferase